MNKDDASDSSHSKPPAWFVVNDPNEEEEFFPGQPVAPVQPAPTLEMPADVPVGDAGLSAADSGGPVEGPAAPGLKEASPEAPPVGAAPGVPEPTPEDPAPPEPPTASGVDVSASVPPTRETVPEDPVQPSHPEAATPQSPEPGPQAPRAEEPLRETLPPAARSVGFTRAELMRLGRTGLTAPQNTAALLVVVRTPQRVRRGQIFPLNKPRTVVGKARGVDFLLDDPSVADLHAVITYEQGDGGAFWLQISDSAPVEVNGVSAARRTQLSGGDRIQLGNTGLVFLETDLEGGAA